MHMMLMPYVALEILHFSTGLFEQNLACYNHAFMRCPSLLLRWLYYPFRELHYGWGAYNAAWKCNGSWKTDRDSEQPCSESRKRLSCGESISMPRCTSLLSLFGISPNDVITFHFLLSLNSNRFIFQSRLMKESTFYRNILHHYFILCQPTRNYWCSWI